VIGGVPPHFSPIFAGSAAKAVKAEVPIKAQAVMLTNKKCFIVTSLISPGSYARFFTMVWWPVAGAITEFLQTWLTIVLKKDDGLSGWFVVSVFGTSTG
jgi:hypothetical protein